MLSKRHYLLSLLLTLTLGVTACGGGDEDNSGNTDAPAQDGGAGTLNLGVNVEPTNWSASVVQVIMFPFTRQLYDSLIEYDDELGPEPRLATEWVIADDATNVMITLRDDVVFHSGRPMTAEDVAANLEYFANPDLGQQLFGPMSVVEGWEVIDDTTLKVTFIQPLAELQITDLLQSWTIGDPEIFDQYAQRGEGTGPYKFVEWLPGERIVLERNPDYWGEPVAYDDLVYRVFSDMDSLIAGFESGAIDVAVDVPALDAERLRDQNTVLEGFPGALINQFRMNPTAAPLDDVQVRLAINYATDRESIAQALYFGFGGPTALPYAPTSRAFDEELAESLSFDLDRAEELLRDSGLSGDELRASVLVPSSSAQAQQAAQILQSSLAEIGFTLDIELRDIAEATERLLAGDFQLFFGAIGNAQKYPTRITTNSIYRTVDNPVQATELFPEYAPAVAAAAAAVTEEEQEAAFAELNRVLTDNLWVVTVGYLPTLWLSGPNSTGVGRNVDNMLELVNVRPTG